MHILDFAKQQIPVFDGAMGTLLQARGLPLGELPETWNCTHPEEIVAIHRAYLDAGCHILKTNTFGANRFKFGDELEKVVLSGIQCARNAIGKRVNRFVALDVGPIGKLLRPLGDLDFEDAVSVFSEVVRIGARAGVDLILIETMNDSYETKAAVLAAKEQSDLPVFVTNVYDASGKTMTGSDIPTMVSILEGLRVDALGMNCSLGPDLMRKFMPLFAENTSLPIIVNPNAGLPRIENGKTIFTVTPDAFAQEMVEIVRGGAGFVGGCCGTTPETIRALVRAIGDMKPGIHEYKPKSVFSSYTHTVRIGDEPILIGERINPSGSSEIAQALRSGDMRPILNEAVAQEDARAHALDVNVGLPEIDEAQVLPSIVYQLQSITDTPLQLDTSNSIAMERAARLYNGKPLLNSVNGKASSMRVIFPIAQKYGGVVVALTLDENGIPETVEGRVAIAKKIIGEAAKYGIASCELVFDPLAMAVSSGSGMVDVTLGTIRALRALGLNTVLGISNISFGLPDRDLITANFFTLAMQCGLNAAIMNPLSREVRGAWISYRALQGHDANCMDYIEFTAANKSRPAAVPSSEITLHHAIAHGLKADASAAASAALASAAPMQVITEQIIPALDEVGRGFEQNEIYLPQLLMSAEAATAAFEIVKRAMPNTAAKDGETVLIATVRGDIHDIGKNIVRVLLENYGFSVIDLGRDVAPEDILSAAKKNRVSLVGLSALMTTTVPSMQETIALLHRECPEVKVVVGGAVLTRAYAKEIGADCYAADAMETVRYAERILRS